MKKSPVLSVASLCAAASVFILTACVPTVSTISWANDGAGFIQYQTNDPTLYNIGQAVLYPASNEATLTTATVIAKKMSGEADMGFGMIFCAQDINNYYWVGVSTTGYYRVFKKVLGVETPINIAPSTAMPWTSSPYIAQGYGASNRISVTNAGVNTFSVSIGGNFVFNFTDTSFTGGQCGFYVGIGGTDASQGLVENFPLIPEDVRFQMVSPMAIP